MPLSPSHLCTVVSRGRTNATPHPLTKIVSSQGFEPWPAALVPSTQPLYHEGYSMLDHVESTIKFGRDVSNFTPLRRVVGFKYRDVSDFVLNLVTCVTIVITTTSRCLTTCRRRDSSGLTTCPDGVRLGRGKKSVSQLA